MTRPLGVRHRAPGGGRQFVLCGMCGDAGYVVRDVGMRGGGVQVAIVDACPDCARRAENAWRWACESIAPQQQGRAA